MLLQQSDSVVLKASGNFPKYFYEGENWVLSWEIVYIWLIVYLTCF